METKETKLTSMISQLEEIISVVGNLNDRFSDVIVRTNGARVEEEEPMAPMVGVINGSPSSMQRLQNVVTRMNTLTMDLGSNVKDLESII